MLIFKKELDQTCNFTKDDYYLALIAANRRAVRIAGKTKPKTTKPFASINKKSPKR
jgi:hypothetical protein